MVMAVLIRPQTQLTLFLRMHAKEVTKTAKMFSDKQAIPLSEKIGIPCQCK